MSHHWTAPTTPERQWVRTKYGFGSPSWPDTAACPGMLGGKVQRGCQGLWSGGLTMVRIGSKAAERPHARVEQASLSRRAMSHRRHIETKHPNRIKASKAIQPPNTRTSSQSVFSLVFVKACMFDLLTVPSAPQAACSNATVSYAHQYSTRISGDVQLRTRPAFIERSINLHSELQCCGAASIARHRRIGRRDGRQAIPFGTHRPFAGLRDSSHGVTTSRPPGSPRRAFFAGRPDRGSVPCMGAVPSGIRAPEP